MIHRATARHVWTILVVVALSGCETKGPLAELEAPGALQVSSGQSWYMLGVQLLATREPAQAERAFNRSLALEGLNARTLTGLGIATSQMGQMSRALMHLENARDLAPEDATVHTNLGVVLYDLGRYHEAKQAFQTAFILSSGSNEVAALYLAKAETAIAIADQESQPDPAVSHRLQRLGASEYRLMETNEQDAEGAESSGTPG
ncbi:tetratricopeptide repeat protein [Limibaculum sp. M0105]|uniref:Tetratricopeptide repeat protein n=1 Tax=Thermohalobaculum xanthum TaxID=2753746 RepID=A0A8J7M9R5_9RHOB|nr:tetratricopeptide repeat protein [Thermohalobaculum xanthum]MBK0400778.1 tetratricopeptide repeat protein [Thermohalobaculum xanthum]